MTIATTCNDIDSLRAELTEQYHRADRLESKLAAGRKENARLRRDVRMLSRQLDGLHDTDKGALQIRCDEQAAEILELKAQLAKLGVIA